MAMQGSQPSKLSRDLSNIVVQLRSAQTRGVNPRKLTSKELAALEQRRLEIKEQMRQTAAHRTAARVNLHTTAQQDRGIAAVEAAKGEILAALAQQPRRPSDGARVVSTLKRALKHSVGSLRSFLRDRGVCPAGRKEDLAEAFAKHYTIDELEEYQRQGGHLLPKRKRQDARSALYTCSRPPDAVASRTPPSKATCVDTASRQQRRHLAKYEKGAAGHYEKVRNVCTWDLDETGRVMVFASRAQLLEHEAHCGARRKRGEYPPGGYQRVPEEQRALAQRLEEQTREIVGDEAEMLHQRFDDVAGWQEEQRKKLDDILAHVERSSPQRSEPQGERGPWQQLHEMERAMALTVGELREFLAHKGIRAVGTKALVARAVVRTWEIGEVEAFLSSAAPKPQREEQICCASGGTAAASLS